MISKILNYGIRILIILLGISFLSGIFNPLPDGYDKSVLRVFGVVFILFGIYRIVSYRSATSRYLRTRRYYTEEDLESNDEDDDDDE